MKYFMLILLIGFSATVKSQYQLKGSVRSTASNLPLPNASLRIKGQPNVSRTDAAGHFSIVIPNKETTLAVSHIGHVTKEIQLTFDGKEITILLDEVTNILNEVKVSTGYQTLPKERTTGSFSVVSNHLLNEQVSTNLLTRLEAVANGLITDRNTTSSGRLMIRGLSTIQGIKEPLIILDNFPYEGDPNLINPNDIDNVTILKDAAAASIWGSKAGNGVIVMTSKKGKFNQPIQIAFSANSTIGAKPNLFDIPQISTSDFIDVETMLFDKGYYASDLNAVNKPVLSPVVELLLKRANGDENTKASINRQIAEMKTLDVRNDFKKYVYQTSLNQQYALNLNGGTDAVNWLISTGYDQNSGTLNEKLKRFSLRGQHTIRLFKNLTLSSGIFYTQSNNAEGRPGYGNISSKNNALYPYAQLADADGNPLAIPKDWRLSYLQTLDSKLLNWQYYPLEDMNYHQVNGAVNSVTLNTGINYKLPFGLNADIKYQYQRQQALNKNLSSKERYFVRNLINSFTQITADGTVTNVIPPGGILDQSAELLRSDQVRGTLTYDKTWNHHSIIALAGAELRNRKNSGSNGRLYGYDEHTLTFKNVDYDHEYPNFISNLKSFIPSSGDLSETLTRFVSTFANAAYTYRNKYTLSASARRDASNLFGVNTNDKWKPLWSAGLSWNIGAEPFFNNNLFTFLKLRATYGYSGNVDARKTGVSTISYVGINPSTSTPYSRFNTYANPELKWETVKTINLGLDFRTLGNRLTGSVEYYDKRGHDLFGTTPVDYTSGIGSTVLRNVASMSGRGFDVELNSQNIKGAFEWTSSINLSTNHDKVEKYYLKSKQGSTFLSGTNTISGLEGNPVYSVFAYKWAGLDPSTGDPMGFLKGKISKVYAQITGVGTQVDDLRNFGSALPTIFGSVGNTFSYKDVSLTIRISYKLGYYFRRTSIDYPSLYSSWIGHADFADRWQQSGDENSTNVPALVYPFSARMQTLYTYSEPLISKGDHIRFQYVSLSYNLDQRRLGNLPIKNLRLFCNVNNPGVIWRANKHGIDPDFNAGTSMPVPVSISFGLQTNL